MKTNIEKVLSFLIELARLFLTWKKGGNRVWGMGYRVWGGEKPKTAKAESKNPERGRKKPTTAKAENPHPPSPNPHTPKKGDGEWGIVNGEEKKKNEKGKRKRDKKGIVDSG